MWHQVRIALAVKLIIADVTDVANKDVVWSPIPMRTRLAVWKGRRSIPDDSELRANISKPGRKRAGYFCGRVLGDPLLSTSLQSIFGRCEGADFKTVASSKIDRSGRRLGS